MRNKFLLTTAGLALAAGACPSIAMAQSAEESTAKAEDVIIVTAQRRSEALQDVPVAVTAFKTDTLTGNGVSNLLDLAKVTPSLLITEGSGQGQPYIRGVGGRNITPGNEATTSIYIDGVYQVDKSAMLMQGFADMDSVQVLRGPQGTLFGRNATSGAILLTTKKPQHEFGAMVEGSGGTDYASGRVYVTGPISNTLAASVSGFYSDDFDYVRNRNPANGLGSKVAGAVSQGVRGNLLWEPSSRFSATLSGYWMKGHDGGTMAVQPYDPAPTSLGEALAQAYLGLDIRHHSRSYYGEINPNVRFEGYGASLSLQADLGGFDLKSISAYQHTDSGVSLDLDNSPIPVFFFSTHLKGRAYQQEVNLSSNGSSPFQWITGAFYINYRDGYEALNQYVGLPVPNPLKSHTVPQSLIDAVAAGSAPGAAAYIDQHGFVTVESLGLYGEASYNLNGNTKLTLGLRYTTESSKLDPNNGQTTYTGNGAGNMLVIPSTTTAACAATPTCDGLKTSFNKLTYRAVLDHKFSDDVMAYLSYNRGFKSGVYNISSVTNVTATKPEIIDAFEAGIKASTPDHMLTVNAAAYYYKYNNLQVAIVDPNTNKQISINAAKAKISGLEIETTFRPTRQFTLGANYSTFFTAKYEEFPSCLIYAPSSTGGLTQVPGVAADCSGTRLPDTPKAMLSVTANYDVPLENGGNLGFSALWSHISSFDMSPWGHYDAGVDSAGVAYPAGIGRAPIQRPINTVNASVTYKGPDNAYYVSIWGKDLLNPDNVYRNMFTTSFGYTTQVTRGISGGVTVGLKFGSAR